MYVICMWEIWYIMVIVENVRYIVIFVCYVWLMWYVLWYMWLQNKKKQKIITWEGGLSCARAITHDKDQCLSCVMTIAHSKPACQAACAKPRKGVCRVPTPGTRQTLRLCHVPAWWHMAKIQSLSCATMQAHDKPFFQGKTKNSL